jgi:serine/threonine-protein kinase
VETSREFIELQDVVAGRYSLDRELGRGGMGIVYLARDVALDRPVAIKLLPPALALQPDLAARFVREARTAARLSHPNIVTVHAVEQHRDLAFFVMAYVDGETLGHRVRRAGPLRASEATRVIQEVAWALAYAHANGVVHRDVKPDNILIERGSGRAMVTDFGIARLTDAAGATGPGEMLGTVQYMSPEQALGDPADARSDLYALGVTAYFALTGRLPFEAPTAVAVLGMHVNRDPRPVTELQPRVPPVLASAVHRCLAKAPGDRFQSGEALAEAIGEARRRARETPALVKQFLGTLRAGPVMLAPLLITLPLYLADVPRIAFAIVTGWMFVLLPFAFSVYNARRLLRGGFGLDDVKAALVDREREWLEDAEETHPLRPTTVSPRQLTRAAIGFSAAGAIFVWLGLGLGGNAAPSIGGLLNLGVGALLLSLGVREGWRAAKGSRTGRSFDEPLESRFARVTRASIATARRFLWIASFGLKRPARPGASPEPTEVALASAVDDIFAALPAEERHALGGLPTLVQRLRAEARRLRLRVERDPSDAGARERLATVVSGLEAVRLDLLRLRAGGATLDSITPHLEAIEEFGRGVSAHLRARAEAAGPGRENTPITG